MQAIAKSVGPPARTVPGTIEETMSDPVPKLRAGGLENLSSSETRPGRQRRRGSRGRWMRKRATQRSRDRQNRP
jgi:hypothetical protein